MIDPWTETKPHCIFTALARWLGHLGGWVIIATVLAGCASNTGRETSQDTVSPPDHTVPVMVAPQSEWAEAILYFVIVDRFANGDPSNDGQVDPTAPGAFHGGDLRGLRMQLDELAELGVTTVWITPVVKNIDGFVTGAGFPDWAYHGYWADDFTRLDARFGTEAELRALAEDCHTRGIELLLDVVYNHVGYGAQYLSQPATSGWFRTNENGSCGQDDLTSCVGGLPDLKTELPEVSAYLFDAHLGLAARTGLDGFRLDTVKHVSHAFWQEHRAQVRQRLGGDFFLLGEVWGGDRQVLDPWFEGDELDAGFDFSFAGNVLGFVQGRGRPIAFNRYLERREEVRSGYLLAQYLSSHDVPGALWQLQDDRELFRLAVVLQFTAKGIPVIYYGEEVGRLGGDWPDNRSHMPWGERQVPPGAGEPRDEQMRVFYKQLIAIRRAHPALWRGEREGLLFTKEMLVFARSDPASGDAVVVAVNRGAEPEPARFTPPAEWSGGTVRDLLAGQEFPLSTDTLEVSVPARTARILAVDRPASSPSSQN